MTTKDFVEAFRAGVAKRRTHGPTTPTGVVEEWEQFVGAVEDGYDDNIYEYDNDLSVRDLIDELLEDPAICAHVETAWVIAAVDALDQRFRAIITDQPIRNKDGPWWHSHLPTVAGTELAADLRGFYGYTVPRVVVDE